jgi:hypothetical protein
LVFHLEPTGIAPKPQRIYVYDLNNNRPLLIILMMQQLEKM